MPTDPYGRGTARFQRLKAQVIAEEDGICWLCGKDGADTADHIIPVSRGGEPFDRANLHAAHIRCNQVRGDGRRRVVKVRKWSRDW